MAAVSSEHDALVAELRLLAEAVLDRVDLAVQQYAAAQHPDPEDTGAAGAGDTGPSGGCAWCPVCALGALVRGEPHELLTRLATQIAAIIALIRELLARYLPPPPAGPAGPDPAPPPGPTDRGGGFVSIPVTIRP
nr:hypothetical protein [Rhodococcus phenolicus]